MTTPTEWQRRLGSMLASDHGAGAERGTCPSWTTGEAFGDPERQVELLDLLHRHAAAPPWRSLHPTWLAECLPEEGRLRGWCLMLLPEKVRAAVAELVGGRTGRLDDSATVLFEPLPPPAWLAPWWRREVLGQLDYPLPLPESADVARPLTYLWCFSPDHILCVLERFGLRCVAADICSSKAPFAST